MKPIQELQLGFTDAENYQRSENRSLFNNIFVKNTYLEQILSPSTYFVVGEKGTGKTAYAVFLKNNDYKDTVSDLKYIRETDYHKFVTLKREKHLQLSDYTSIWKVIILLLLSKNIKPQEIDSNPFSKNKKIKALFQAIDDYYANAFAPEIIYALNMIENSKITAELMVKYLTLGGEKSSTQSFNESKFQVNLLYIQNEFEKALAGIKLKSNHILFIDGIDIRPGSIPYEEYLECVKGLAEAIWSINNDFFANIKDSKGRLRAILLLRPDIFNSIGLQNSTNKLRDNSVYLDWRTSYENYRNSQLFLLADKLLASQQTEKLQLGNAWDYYCPWEAPTRKSDRSSDSSFLSFLRFSYSRPRDLVSLLKFLQDDYMEKHKIKSKTFTLEHFASKEFRKRYSEYLLGGVKDQLSFYYTTKDYDTFFHFFSFLKGKSKFDYQQFNGTYDSFIAFLNKNSIVKPKFLETADTFLQFLYDSNIICYVEKSDRQLFFRWCYRQRNPTDISPKVQTNTRYEIHYGLHKALNVGVDTV